MLHFDCTSGNKRGSTTEKHVEDNANIGDDSLPAGPTLAPVGTTDIVTAGVLPGSRDQDDLKSDIDVTTVEGLSGARDRDDFKGEDEAETDNEIESVHNDHENDPKPDTQEGEPEVHEDKPQNLEEQESCVDETESKPENESMTPPPPKNTSAETHKSKGSTGLIERAVKGATALGKNAVNLATAKAKSAAAAAKSFAGFEQPVLLYKKKITIDLPYGKGPKTHCRMITYKPINCKGSPCPLISLTIKPSGRCRHEDTHLFVRFAGYN